MTKSVAILKIEIISIISSPSKCFCLCIHTYVCVCFVIYLLSHVWLFCDPMEYSPPGSSVHGISQARILEWLAISSSRGSSRPRDQTWVSCTAGRFFTSAPPGSQTNMKNIFFFFFMKNIFVWKTARKPGWLENITGRVRGRRWGPRSSQGQITEGHIGQPPGHQPRFHSV